MLVKGKDCMKEVFVKDLRKDQEITDFFMAKTLAIKVGANGKQYLDILLADKTGEISGKKWDVSDAEYPVLKAIGEKSIVKIKAVVTEWAGQLQLRVQRIRAAALDDGQHMEDFVKAAPEVPEDMFGYIYETAGSMKDQDLKKLCIKLLTDNREKLMYYPAAQKNHHAELAGLLYHMKRMLMTGERICEVYTNLNRDLLCAGVIIHDIEKLNEIMADPDGIATGYSFEGQLLGHIIQGVKTIDRLTLELGFPREKAIMLEHMILSHHYEPEFGSPKKPLFPEAEALHYLDVLDARMFDMQDALVSTLPGTFSERVWALDNRKLYKPNEGEEDKC
jgi:3'-5' exoribonuclease